MEHVNDMTKTGRLSSKEPNIGGPPQHDGNVSGNYDMRAAQLERLPTKLLLLIGEWSDLPEKNRHQKRRKFALAKKLAKSLPKGITLADVVGAL